jgi:phytoene synthase
VIPIAEAPIGAPAADAVMARARTENFPVASRALPRRVRAHLLAIYGFARLVDELGDSAAGDRLAALDWLARELELAFEGRAQHPLLVRLSPTLRECSLPREPFLRLIEANRVDQRVSRYATWEELRAYCALSADPVGELVLRVLGSATPERIALSDSICTALQLIEHCQDVAEDLARGRVYLPREDLERFGCTIDELGAAHAGEPLSEVLAFEVARARGLLAQGAPLIWQLNGRARLALAGFVAGGRAALDAIERVRCDVLPGPPRAGRWRRLIALVRTLAERPRAGTTSSEAELASAYAHCESVTRTQAANFFFGIRLLARERRRAMCAVYAFARRIDDIGDGSLGPEEKLRRLDTQAAALRELETAGMTPAGDLVMIALADAHRRFSLPAGALGELIEGVRMDVTGVRYERFGDLELYCRRVAGAIGRVCLAIFGMSARAPADRGAAERLADDLGVALQLTNILRDVREDAENGRVYLPGEDLRRFGLIDDGGAPGSGLAAAPAMLATLTANGARSDEHGEQPAQRLYELMRFEAERARGWFDRGLQLAPMLDRRSAACVLSMARIYRRLLTRIEAHPDQAARRRMSLPAHEKALVAARSMLGGRA